MSVKYRINLLGHGNKLCNLDIVLRKYLEMAIFLMMIFDYHYKCSLLILRRTYTPRHRIKYFFYMGEILFQIQVRMERKSIFPLMYSSRDSFLEAHFDRDLEQSSKMLDKLSHRCLENSCKYVTVHLPK
jgi:hypothetical protein